MKSKFLFVSVVILIWSVEVVYAQNQVDISSLEPITADNGMDISLIHDIDTSPYYDPTDFTLLTSEISPDGKIAVTIFGSTVNRVSKAHIHVWNLEEITNSYSLDNVASYDREGVRISFSPDGKIFALGGEYNRVELFNTKTGKLLKSFDNNVQLVGQISFDNNGTRFAWTNGVELIVHNLESDEEFGIAIEDDFITNFSFHPQLPSIMIGTLFGKVYEWDSGSSETDLELILDTEDKDTGLFVAIEKIGFTHDGRYVFLQQFPPEAGGHVISWEYSLGSGSKQILGGWVMLPQQDSNTTYPIYVNKLLALSSTGIDGGTSILDIDSGNEIFSTDSTIVEISHSEKIGIVYDVDSLHFINLQNGAFVANIPLDGGFQPNTVEFSNNDKVLLLSEYGSRFQIWGVLP